MADKYEIVGCRTFRSYGAGDLEAVKIVAANIARAEGEPVRLVRELTLEEWDAHIEWCEAFLEALRETREAREDAHEQYLAHVDRIATDFDGDFQVEG